MRSRAIIEMEEGCTDSRVPEKTPELHLRAAANSIGHRFRSRRRILKT